MMEKGKLLLYFMSWLAVILSRNSQKNQEKHRQKTSFRLKVKYQMHSAGILKNISVKILKQSRDLLSRRMSSKITYYAEAGWYVFSKMQKASQKKSKNGKPKDVNMGKLPPTEGLLLQQQLCQVVQASMWHE